MQQQQERERQQQGASHTEKEDALPLSEWIEATRPLHLTLEQVRSWKVKSVHRLACLDRNINDLADRALASGPRSASEFLSEGYRAELKVVAGPPTDGSPPLIVGRVLWKEYEEGDEEEYENSGARWNEWEFHVEYAPGCWYPMEKGILTGRNMWPDRKIKGAPIPLMKWTAFFDLHRPYRGMIWKEFPGKTRLGWRGPMVPQKLVDMMPRVRNDDDTVKD